MTRLELNRIAAVKAKEANKAAKIKRELIYNKNPNLCKLCNKSLSYKKRRNTFCNHSCSQSFNNRGIRRHGYETKKCLNCGNKLKNNVSIYCSIRCYNDYKWNEWCKSIDKSGFFEGYDASISGGNAARPKKYILSKQHGKCAICEISEWRGEPVPFILDHINGDSNNWKVNNVRVICRNCDGQLDTYCGKNIGKGTRPFINSRKSNGLYTKTYKQIKT